MWECWGSDVRRAARALAVAFAVLALAAGAAPARDRVIVKHLEDGTVERVRIGPEGVTITRRGGHDSTLTNDSLGVGALVVDEGNDKVRFMGDVEVRPGEKVDGDVVAIFGRVHVAGTVTGSAVSIFGHVEIDRGASVGEDAVVVVGSQRSAGQVSGSEVAVLGGLSLQPGATVGGDAVAIGGRVADTDSTHVAGQTVSMSMLPLTLGLPGLAVALGFVLLGWIVSVFFGWLLGVLFPERLARVATTASRHTFLSIVLAVLSILLWPAVAVLLALTCVGLPIGILMLLLWPALGYAGQLAGTYVLGCKLLRRRLGEGTALAPVAMGSFFLAVLYLVAILCFTAGGAGGALALFFGLVAFLVQLGLSAIGTGAILYSRAGSRGRGEAAPAPGVHAVPGPVAG